MGADEAVEPEYYGGNDEDAEEEVYDAMPFYGDDGAYDDEDEMPLTKAALRRRFGT